MKVYVLHHTNIINESEEEVKLIGVYSSGAEAEKAIQRKLQFPGFCDFPEGFHIDEYEVDRDAWSEGFIIVKLEEI